MKSMKRSNLDPPEIKLPNAGRHESGCRLCAHPEREQIEAEWCAWANTSKLAKRYGLSRDSIYRHALAFNLREKRGKNLRAALERIIERANVVTVNAAAVVSAVAAYAKINSQGAWVDRVERIDLNALFNKMTAGELEAYARDGSLPEWFTDIVGATPSDSQEDRQNG
jgi:hypothetical protein